MDNFEVKKVFKRLDKRYITVEFSNQDILGLQEDDSDTPLHVRVFRYRFADDSGNSDPSWGKTEVELPLDGDRVSVKVTLSGLPDDLARYEIGLVREGVCWVYREWIED